MPNHDQSHMFCIKLARLWGHGPIAAKIIEVILPVMDNHTAEECCRIMRVRKNSTRWVLVHEIYSRLAGTTPQDRF